MQVHGWSLAYGKVQLSMGLQSTEELIVMTDLHPTLYMALTHSLVSQRLGVNSDHP